MTDKEEIYATTLNLLGSDLIDQDAFKECLQAEHDAAFPPPKRSEEKDTA